MCKFPLVFVFKMKKALKFERLFLCLELLTWMTLAVDSFGVKVLLALIYIIIKNKIQNSFYNLLFSCKLRNYERHEQ